MRQTRYSITVPGLVKPRLAAVASDVHDEARYGQRALEALAESSPDLILIPGDLTEDIRDPSRYGFAFARACAAIAPTYVSLGNHEIGGCHSSRPNPASLHVEADAVERYRERLAGDGVCLLTNEWVLRDELVIGGLSSGLARDAEGTLRESGPDLAFAGKMASLPGVKILLCHQPEYYMQDLFRYALDVTVAGHAHGGQIRLFGRGLYSPGQGLFPKWTRGLFRKGGEGCLAVSAGVSNNTSIPRLFNPTEIMLLQLCVPET